jgi:hypothetical protein
MRIVSLGALLSVLLLAACGNDPVAPDPLDGPITGQWVVSGNPSVVIEVGIAAPGTGVLAGCIEVAYDPVARPQDRVRVVMLGSFAHPAVTLAPTADQRQLWSFTGTRQAVDTLVGTGRLEGQSPTTVRLVRVAPAPDC